MWVLNQTASFKRPPHPRPSRHGVTLSAPHQVPSPACLWNQGSFTVSCLSRLSVLLAFSLTVRVKGHRLRRSEGKAASCPEKQLGANVPKAGNAQQLQLGVE